MVDYILAISAEGKVKVLLKSVYVFQTYCRNKSCIFYKKAQLSLTNPHDACEKFARFTYEQWGCKLSCIARLPMDQWSFRGGTRGNAVPIVKNLPERMGTAFRNARERRSHC